VFSRGAGSELDGRGRAPGAGPVGGGESWLTGVDDEPYPPPRFWTADVRSCDVVLVVFCDVVLVVLLGGVFRCSGIAAPFVVVIVRALGHRLDTPENELKRAYRYPTRPLPVRVTPVG
jgi:hypothetical protein